MDRRVRRWWAVPLRLVLGCGFMAHGWAKLTRGAGAFAAVLHALGVPAPVASAWLTIGVELIGGAAILAGAFVRIAGVPLAAILLVAAITVHLPFGFSSIKLVAVTAAGPQFGPVGYEIDLLYLAALVALAIGGAGPLSFDERRRSIATDTGERLERMAAGPGRDSLLPLLRLADDSPSQIDSYYQSGELFVLRGPDRSPRAVALAVPHGQDGTAELKSVAVSPELQGQGVGSRMLALVFRELRREGFRRVVVATASSGVRELAFYQRAGFRPLTIERDVFTEARGYRSNAEENGIALRDAVWFDRELQGAAERRG
jgi:putative oxidoreductase